MPGTTDVESQYRFLISCIRHSNSGKVDFEAVAAECGIVSKGAASKRYERLMKAHGINQSGVTGGVKKEGAKKAPSKKVKKEPASKKRKLAEVKDEDQDDEEEDIKGEIKRELKTEDAMTVKAERPHDGFASAILGSPPGDHLSVEAQEDDDVLIVSAKERRDATAGSPFGSDGQAQQHHQHHYPHLHLHHAHSPIASIPGFHAFDYAAANVMGYPQPTSPRRRAENPPSMTSISRQTTRQNEPYPYGFHPTAWPSHHNTTHDYL
ncbi:hypothetical protein GGR56DRAFT_679607 [Xylariaceae sp. FL0804]|nr:hypothetical protein GGR56DRAFT_679607 [Xylariaceae sp. FL0804]